MKRSLWLGVGLMVVGGLAIGLGTRIEVLGLGQNADPGPRMMPLVLGGILALGGLYELARGLIGRRSTGKAEESEGEAQTSLPKGAIQRMLVLFVGLVAYVALVGYLGFALSTLVFATLMMWWLGVKWPVALSTTLGLLVVIHLLFVQVFKVQLPAGVFNLPF